MGGSSKVAKPKEPDIGQDISKYVSGYGQALPSVLSLEQQYRPEFGKANIADIGQYQQGIQALQSGATQTAQQQLQAQRQEFTVNQLLACVNGLAGQVARATNSQVVVGSTGVSGTQTANPTNVNA